MKVEFLGNGGFISDGLPYNSFLIDGDFLVECPPDIMRSLRANGTDFRRIKRIYLSHFHGDHCFGMPFFTLNLFNHHIESGRADVKIETIGPRGVRDRIVGLQKTAISADNPSVAWIDEALRFTEIDEASRIELPDSRRMVFHVMSHSLETFGFSILDKKGYLLTYLADTIWNDSFIDILSRKPRYVICDLNGEKKDTIKQHMSESDIIEKAMPVTGNDTTYIGTHLRHDRVSRHDKLVYIKAGSTIEVG
jgi:ribonuclease BN (tRNA processing enzyme)